MAQGTSLQQGRDGRIGEREGRRSDGEEKETRRIEEWDEKLGEGGEGRSGLYTVIS